MHVCSTLPSNHPSGVDEAAAHQLRIWQVSKSTSGNNVMLVQWQHRRRYEVEMWPKQS